MALAAEVAEHVRDLFGGLGPVRVRAMFGGAGIFLDDAMFGLIDGDGEIYLRGDKALGADLEAEGAARFVYGARGKSIELPYWRLPDAALDDPEEALAWARRTLVPAEAAAARKRQAKSRTKR
ncbi:MAG: TfoX/Sxy family protein [Pseudomonadota bacterium]